MEGPEQYQQASAIPFRRLESGVEYCLITSTSKGDWVFPKGNIDPGETPPETALKEAYEEAGISGHLLQEPLGTYEYRKWGADLRVIVYLFHVAEIEEDWEEADIRARSWFDFPGADRAVERPHLKGLLRQAHDRLMEAE